MHADIPSAAVIDPAAQSEHVPSTDAPRTAENFPALHAVHAALDTALVASDHDPFGHWSHWVWLV